MSSNGLPPSAYFTLYRAEGCVECNEIGHNGRVGIHELLVPNATMRKSINASGITAVELNRHAVDECSMTTLSWDAMEKFREGRYSIDDVLAKVRVEEFDTRPEWMFAELGLSVPDSPDTLPFLGDSTYPHAAYPRGETAHLYRPVLFSVGHFPEQILITGACLKDTRELLFVRFWSQAVEQFS